MIGIKRRLRVSSAGADEALAAFRAGEEARAASDPVRACDLFETAARAGLAAAQHSLATCYYTGVDRPLDYRLSLEWCRRAADQGLARSYLRTALAAAAPSLEREAARQIAAWRAGDRGGFAILSRAPAPALVPVRHAGCAPRGAPSIEKQSAVQFLDSPLYFPLPLANCPK